MKKFKVLVGMIGVGLLVSACSSNDRKEESKTLESGYKVEHVHGLALTNDDFLYMASHEGLIKTEDQGDTWSLIGDNDFMGFHMQSDGTMLTSGHPGKTSDLPDPIGLMESKDNGMNWDSKSLIGEVDFHILTSNESNPNLLYGIIQMETGNYKTGIYKSTDKGESWGKLDSTGLPDDLHGIYTLLSLPNDENVMLAGTNEGVYRSDDGGQTWNMADRNRLITTLSVIPGSLDLLSYSITEDESGMMISRDNGVTWEKIGLNLGEDAVAYFAIHPKQTEKIAALTFENNLLLSEDGGQNWDTLMEEGKLKN